MEKELIEAFILEYKQAQEGQERWNRNHINFDNYFKYSGRIEKTTEIIAQYYTQGKYGRMITAPILRTKDPVVKWYFQNPNESMESIAIRFNVTYTETRSRITKYLKKRTNDKGEKIFA